MLEIFCLFLKASLSIVGVSTKAGWGGGGGGMLSAGDEGLWCLLCIDGECLLGEIDLLLGEVDLLLGDGDVLLLGDGDLLYLLVGDIDWWCTSGEGDLGLGAGDLCLMAAFSFRKSWGSL